MQAVIYFELLDNNKTITSNIYYQQLQSLKHALHTKGPALLNRQGVIPQQVRPHNARKTQKLNEFG